MKLVKLNGCVHVRGESGFVKVSKKNVLEALRNSRKSSEKHVGLTKEQLLSKCVFDDSGELTDVL